MSRVRYCPTCEVAWADDSLVCWWCGLPDGRSKWLMLSQSCHAPDPLRVAREEATRWRISQPSDPRRNQ